jgi:hypothetical protein
MATERTERTERRVSPLAAHRLRLVPPEPDRRPDQAWIAARAKCGQGQVSKIERGHLPRKKDRERYASAYRLSLKKFVDLVLESRSESWELPLWQYAERARPGAVEALPLQAAARRSGTEG